MSEIVEIPLSAEAPAPTQEQAEDPGPEPEIQPKKRGRPAGAKNKAKPPPAPQPAAKPAPKPRAVKRKAAVVFSDSSDEEEAPRVTRRAPVARNEELDRRALAADVLGLLQEQRVSRTVAKRDHYASWFQNM